MLKRLFFLITIFLFSNIAFAKSEVKIPELVGRVMFEGSLQPTESQKENLLTSLRNLEKENKIQMGILVVDSIKPYSIEEYSIMVAEKWKVGQKGIDNGVLMIVATKDRKARLEVGNGLQGSLTDAMSKRIQMEKMVPEFKKGNFIEGIIATVEGIKIATVKEVPVISNAIEMKKLKEESEPMSAGKIFLFIFGGFAGIGGVVTYLLIKNSKNKEYERKRHESNLSEYKRRQSEYESSTNNYTNTTQSDHATRLAEQRRREAEYARQNATAAQNLSKPRSTTSSSTTKKKSNSSSSSRSSYSNDDNSRKSSSSYTGGISSKSSNDDDNKISGGGSFSGGGASSEW